MKRTRATQTELFGAPQPTGTSAEDAVADDADADDARHTRTGFAVRPAEPLAEHVALAARVPHEVRFGTSSWSFPGWAGLVYDRAESNSRLSRDGLRAYAQHPLLRTVGVDRTFYAPIAAPEFEVYAGQVPPDFRFLVKAHAELTTPGGLRRGRGGALSDTHDLFLNSAHAIRHVVEPAVTGLGDRLGVLLFQFPPLSWSGARLAAFPEALARFLEALPRGVPYAVEVRNRGLLADDVASAYAHALRAGAATHCYSVHPSMPGVLRQREKLGSQVDGAGPVAVRWMLRPDQDYESARAAWAPFHKLAAPDLATRGEVATLLQGLAETKVKTIVIANNKAEGSAPRTLTELARLFAPASVADSP